MIARKATPRNSSTVLRKLGTMPVAEFMRQHWQQRPLLIRQAIAMTEPLVSWTEMAELAARDEVESRLLESRQSQWHLTHGPIDRLPPRRRAGWTLLVQGVDLHLDKVHALLQRFRFLPDARLDDIMVSIASDGGGVGPHWDSYDVFLLQLEGRRRWRIGPTGYPEKPPACVPDLPLKIIANPRFSDEYLLEPGDMLYLPPGWAHDGVAMGPCTTLSVGFRTPGRDELLQAWLNDAADQLGADPTRYQDPGAASTGQPGAIPTQLAKTMSQWLRDWRPSRAEIDDFIGRYLSEPKPGVWFERPDGRLSLAQFKKLAIRSGLQLDRRTRMLYRSRSLFINGERAECELTRMLRELVNRRHLPSVKVAEALENPVETALLHKWWTLGWLKCDRPA